MHVYKNDIIWQLTSQLISDGIIEDVANSVVNALVTSEMSGDTAHGLRMYPIYRKLLQSQDTKNIEMKIIRESVCFAIIDGAYLPGLYTATKCMQFAIDKAHENGMFTVFVRNANTYGSAFVYTLQAAQQGMIGITMANTPAQMTVYGGGKRLLGTNPLCYAIPAMKEWPILFDMASSAAAKSRINEASEKGESIPDNWGLNKFAEKTTNPQEVLNGGFVLPFAPNAKGYGIAMMIDIFSGLLSGAACLDEVGFFSSGKMNVGQLFIAIDPTMVYGPDFCERVDDYIRKVKDSGEKVQMPGENKLRNIYNAENEGFKIDDVLFTDIFDAK